MEMLERCPGCSVAREVEAKKAETGPTFVSSSRRARPCANCGYDGPFLPGDDSSSARDSLPSFAGARAKLATATQDLFRLSGSHSLPSPGSNSIPVEASVSEAPPKVPDAPTSSARKPEASIMFSLEALMKANQAPAKPGGGADDASQLWNMQAAEPLFGTAADEALLTTPLKMEPAQSMDSMTLPSETPNARRWWPIALAASAGLALAAGGIWVFGSGGAAVSASTPASEQAALEAQPPVEPPPVLPAPGEPASAALPAPSEPAPTEPSPQPVPDAVAAAPGDGSGAPAGLTEAGAAQAAVAAATPAPAEPAKEKDKVKDKPSSRKTTPARAPAPRAAAPIVASKALVPFDKAAAKAALNGAAAQAASCGAGGAPGKGKIQITFAPSGKVSDAQLVEGPFAGTTAGKCALREFRAAKVPAFAGAPVTVAKSFKVD